MEHELDIPDFLNRKTNGVTTSTIEERRAYCGVTAPKQEPVKVIDYSKDEALLTEKEHEELTEIRAMVKTSLVHAKRMASDWVSRTSVRAVQARRRHWLKTIKGLGR